MNRNRIWPASALLFIALVGAGARYAIGSVYSAAEAQDLLNALAETGLYLGSSIATASATILALMLTLVGMINRIDADFNSEAYANVRIIGRLATLSLMMSLIVLLAFVLPVGEFEKMPANWYAILYNLLFAGCVIMVALIGATVVMIYRTLQRVLVAITPKDDEDTSGRDPVS